jgi:hypothetical protein
MRMWGRFGAEENSEREKFMCCEHSIKVSDEEVGWGWRD